MSSILSSSYTSSCSCRVFLNVVFLLSACSFLYYCVDYIMTWYRLETVNQNPRYFYTFCSWNEKESWIFLDLILPTPQVWILKLAGGTNVKIDFLLFFRLRNELNGWRKMNINYIRMCGRVWRRCSVFPYRIRNSESHA